MRQVYLAIIVLLLLPLLSINTYTVQAQSSSYIKITLIENEGISRTNYTVPVHIVLDNFPDWSLITPNTIGFLYDNTTPCYFWIQKYSTLPGSVDMLAYIKVPYIPAYGNVTIYMYYNTTEYTSYNNPYQVFKFFTNFSDPTILNNADIFLHDTTNDYVTINNNTLVVHAAGDVIYGAASVQFPLSVSLQDSEIIFHARWQYSGLTYPVALIYITDGTIFTSFINTFPNDGYGFAPFSYDTAIYKFNDTITSLVRSGQSTPNGVEQTVYFIRQGSRLLGKGTNTATLEAYDSEFTTLNYLGFLVWCSDTGTGNYIDLYVDWIAVRDYVGDDPQVVISYVSGGQTIVVSPTPTSNISLNVNLNIAPFANKTYSPIYNLYVDIGIISGIIVALGTIIYIALFKDNNRFGVVFMLVLIVITGMIGITRTLVLTGEYYINGSMHYIYDYNPVAPIYHMLIIVEFGVLLMIIFDPIIRKGKKRFLILAS